MSYIELYLHCDAEFAEIATAELAEIGFESFTDAEDGIKAYCQEENFDQNAIIEVFDRYKDFFEFTYQTESIAKQNWNATWEENYQPIQIEDQILVRASFHDANPSIKHNILINPKMSFGTGHHETTSMMMTQQLSIDFVGKSVLDIGCGTGILAILAEKLGANKLAAFDIEEWAAENSKENAQLNDCQYITVRQGTIEQEPKEQYDILLANINRNILLRDVSQYVDFLKQGGSLLVSGFYTQDQADIVAHFETFGLHFENALEKNNWACVKFGYR